MSNSGSVKKLLIASMAAVFITVALGGMLRAAGGESACPDWPACFGRWTPPALAQGTAARLDYAHRFVTALAASLIAAAVWLARRSGAAVSVLRLLDASALLMAGQVMLGGWVWANRAAATASWFNALHLGLSLGMSALLAAAVVGAYSPRAATPQRVSSSTRLAWLAMGAMFVLLISGAAVTASGASQACRGWLVCGESLFPAGPEEGLHLAHRLSTLVAGGVLLLALAQAWRSQRANPAALTAITAATVFFFSQALLGARMSGQAPAYMLALHQATAAATLAAAAIYAAACARFTPEDADQEGEAASASLGARLKDFLLLTKPVVVALLLVTTFAGMVIGAEAWPDWATAFWTLLGGFMAAGGSGAINQYIDRYDDERMQRTQKRPIPSGRLTPAEGLAFGVGMALTSFYVMTALVNLTAALLSLAGIIYYVVIYSLMLKKTTVQNIVIGGGAGAIPPLVGWAAATGSLNIPSLFLFAVIFLWTPPHFWALALVRRKDYARAGVPMLPVVRGERQTRRQIMIYTLELVALTLALPVFGLGGAVYFVGAAALGGWLLLAAFNLWKQGGNRVAWKMYRYSSMYLAFLFVVLMVDALI